MSLDIETLRKLKFKDFCDLWLDQMKPELDYAGEYWIELFRNHIFQQIIELRQKVEKMAALVKHLETDEVYEVLINEFVKERTLLDLPAYESLLPTLQAVGADKDGSFLEVVAMLKAKLNYDERTDRNNTNTPPKDENQSNSGQNN